ncbi:MAG TPA: hypothetical protein P5142_12205 [Spirochaetia bacterium]|nr:hypothetical protein [Spirochaetia bacterium]
MTKAETSILESRTPEEYIDRSLKAKLAPAAKARLARLWMESTGYTKEDILRARNRHPYWKRKKMEGSAERTRRRLAAHDYSGGGSVDWSPKLVEEFLSLNGTQPSGRYERKDWELAEHFGATIPSIQYMRRKLRKVRELLGPRAPAARIAEYLSRAESVLSRGKGAVEELVAAEKKRAAVPAKPRKAVKARPAAKKAPAKAGKPARAGKPAKAGKKAAPKAKAKARKAGRAAKR